MTTQPSNDELMRLLQEAIDIMIGRGVTDDQLQYRQLRWVRDVSPILQNFDQKRQVSPMEILKAALSHMTTEEHAEIAETARQIVAEADREFKRYLKRERGE